MSSKNKVLICPVSFSGHIKILENMISLSGMCFSKKIIRNSTFLDVFHNVSLKLVFIYSSVCFQISSTVVFCKKSLILLKNNDIKFLINLQICKADPLTAVFMMVLIHKIFETNSSFHVKERTTRKV